MNLEDKIDYEILDDGTCSYCGKEAPMIKLPDGDVTRSDECPACEEFNDELGGIRRSRRFTPPDEPA